MRRTWRWTAAAIVAVMGAAAFGCAGTSRGAAPKQAARSVVPAPAVSSTSPAPSPAAVRILEAAFNEDSDGARVVLSADAPLLYTAYEPRADLFVLDLPGADLSRAFVPLASAGNLVSSVRVEPVVEMGKRLTRVTIAHRDGTRSDVHSLGQGLAISFEPPRGAQISPAEAPAVEAPAPSPTPPVAVAEIAPPPTSRAERAHVLEEVRAVSGPGGVTVSLLADGVLEGKDFVLESPPRLVIDLPGVRNGVRRRVVPVAGGLVSRVRVSQFQSSPEAITRVVLDLARPLPHAIEPDGERLTVRVEAPATAAAQPVAMPGVAAAEQALVPRMEKTQISPAPEKPQPESRPVEPAAVKAAPPEPIRLTSPVQTEPAAAAPPVAEAPVPQKTANPVPAVEPPRKAQRPAAKPATPKAPTREEALFEAAAAVLAQEEGAKPDPAVGTFQPRTIAETQSQFTGEPISLDLKDADIKDVFRTISQFTQLNIVVDPEVKGTVTVQLEDVPWDQALDLILKQNSLGYVLENNIMRIATTAKLQAEQADRARLAEARQAAEATRTVIKKLSYAKAGDLTPTLKSVMSRRGDIVVDTRTNTLIIREIPTYLPGVLQLIENLDTATPQVMIEARIVETTKSFGRSLGINWGFTGTSDVTHGNTTGLIFPNNGEGTFRVPLEVAQTIATVRLGNILNTFNLDVALSAAENQGLVKIISSPKLATLSNTAASIQSGVQLPVQTTVNNTTTVIYVDATLKLTVTPQITNEGTVLLTVNVAKKEPLPGFNIAGGQNVPISVRQYQGEVLVRDGGTTVIGGIFLINDQDQNNMIPGLWKIPILGNLFKNKSRTEKHDELLIFITPRILRQ